MYNKYYIFLKDTPKDASLLLILKWGGELTPSGRIQAEELGRVFRCMYPGGQGKEVFDYDLLTIKKFCLFNQLELNKHKANYV